MKKYFTTLLALLCCHFIAAQTDSCFIIKEHSPNEWQALTGGRHFVDMNDDDRYDFEYDVDVSSTLVIYIELFAREGACFHRVDIPGFEYNYPEVFNTFTDYDTPFNDTSLLWKTDVYGPRIFSETNIVGHYHLDTLVFKSGIRNGHEGEYYYGWMEAYAVVSYNYDTVYFHLARTCYCTIPNYPLRWGQTSLNTNVDETKATDFANIYPNPTKNFFTVTGKDLKAAEVINTLGQHMTTVQGKGETLQIDIANLPAGVYFINITDEEGRKCVRKVVKE